MCALTTKDDLKRTTDPISLAMYSPSINTEGLIPGIDNLRFDVSISPKFIEFCKGFVLQLIAKHSESAQLLHTSPGQLKPGAKKEFRELLQSLLLSVLNRANVEKKPKLELIAQGAILKYLLSEVQSQYLAAIAQGREKLKLLLRPGQEHNPRVYQLQEIISTFQTNKKLIFHRVGNELVDLIDGVRRDLIRKTRESFFGADAHEAQTIFSNPLIFAEDGKNDYISLERYVLLGSYEQYPDYAASVGALVRTFVEQFDTVAAEAKAYHSLRDVCAAIAGQIEAISKKDEVQSSKRGLFSFASRGHSSMTIGEYTGRASHTASLQKTLAEKMEEFRTVSEAYALRLGDVIAAPENAVVLVDFLQTEQQLEQLRKQNASTIDIERAQQVLERQLQAIDRLHEQFAAAGLIPYILAAYETAKIYQDLCPPINPQQLKVALVDSGTRRKVLDLVDEYRFSSSAVDTIETSAERVRDTGPREIRMVLVRFLRDYMRYQHDLRKLGVLMELLDLIHFPLDAKQRELSEMNHTLYEFLLPSESKDQKSTKVSGHVILKADIRGSTSITAELLERELNPASYFSLNFFNPINKLLPRYGAAKVFLEGDAIILSIMEEEGKGDAYSVARACCLAKEMIEGVRAVNDRAQQKNLPLLEMGVGICYQASAPMYLMDGDRPIMISAALNLSDRLSGCGKLARKAVGERNRFFSVFRLHVVSSAESEVEPDESLFHYNIEGIEINDLAFEKLCNEIAMTKVEMKFPILHEQETVELFCGMFPMGESFQKLVVRRARVACVDAKNFKLIQHADRVFYEVCSSKPLYDFVGKQLGW